MPTQELCPGKGTIHNGDIQFGEIELFVSAPTPCALIGNFNSMTSTLLNLAAHPARESLLAYRPVDLLRLHIVPIDMSISNSKTAVPL